MITLKGALANVRDDNGRVIAMSRIGRTLGMSPSMFCRLVNRGEYPSKMDADEVTKRIGIFLTAHGVNSDRVEFPGVRTRAPLGAGPVRQEYLTDEELTLMQLDRNALKLFGLRSNPFINDVESDDDVFIHKGYTDAQQAIRDAIEERSFLAIVADSGSGKTTIWDGIESEYGLRNDAVICKPELKARDRMTPDHLARAMIFALMGESVAVKANAEDRGRQLSRALREARSGTMDRKVVLMIDDAHFCTTSVLRQMKTFYEEKVGRYRLLAIILVGLPELRTKLAQFAEIGNRIRLIEISPVPVADYLKWKLGRAGSSVEKLFDEDGFKAFVERFPRAGRGPNLGRPLIVNATCIRAMVKLYENGAQPGERITRAIVDSLPGTHSARRVA